MAEYQENLDLVSVLVSLPEGHSAEDRPSAAFQEDKVGSSVVHLNFGTSAASGSKSSVASAYPINLPVPVESYKPVTPYLVNDRLEIKMKASSRPAADESSPIATLMGATQLSNLKPSSFICSSCSLPLVQLPTATYPLVDLSEAADRPEPKIASFQYSDLPSEYWGELVEAWMCHSEQKLSKDVTGKGNGSGMIPKSPSHVLVGGSYILVDQEAVTMRNIAREAESTTQEVSTRRRFFFCVSFLSFHPFIRTGQLRKSSPPMLSVVWDSLLACYLVRQDVVRVRQVPRRETRQAPRVYG